MIQVHVALLRGINVSGHRIIKMVDLRSWLTAAGFEEVQTYIQSGNVLFRSSNTPASDANRLKAVLRDHTGWEIPVCVRSLAQLRHLESINPFPEEALVDPRKLHVTLLDRVPDTHAIQSIAAATCLPDRFETVGDTVFLHTPHGYSKTKLTNAFFEKAFSCGATTRNWKTIGALIAKATNTK